MDKKSPDAFRTISEVADWLGVPTHVLRFWESRFSQVKPVKRAGGRRYYRPTDMALLGGIRKLLHEDGMTIRGVQKLLREQGVKHVAAMSPLLDSPPLPQNAEGNVVSFDPAERARDGQAQSGDGQPQPDEDAATTPDVTAPPAEEIAEAGISETDADTSPATPTDPLAPLPQKDRTIAEALENGPSTAPAPEDIVEESAAPVTTDPSTIPSTMEDGEDANVAEAQTEVTTAPDTTAPAEAMPSPSAFTEEDTPTTSADPATDPLPPLPEQMPPEESATSAPAADTVTGEADTEAEQPSPTEAAQEGEAVDPPASPQPMDLFGFADTLPGEAPDAGPADPPATFPAAEGQDPAPTTPTDSEPDATGEALSAELPDLADDASHPTDTDPDFDAGETPVAPTLEQPPEQDTGDGLSEDMVAVEHGQEDAEADPTSLPPLHSEPEESDTSQPEEIPIPPESPAEPDLPPQIDLSHIPADPEGDDPEVDTPLILTLRDIGKRGTDVHLPVLQALADQLDALLAQMDRSNKR
ncbi:MerR HTH family regulatory protein [Aliiroseovarius crassostreae]|uniref:MerR family transcriptional regulator n=1 Tax=Aliiroseovarius crassostreae TaxID=154981 RepID=UPI0008ECADF8|nr:MerR family transcriptional regulator [Aliiroseovarius crassostreae]SFU59345.1 MerR HTH family regulatory protein [Aliiroseovarius crassostreae]